jgi:uncharacterized protein
LKFFIFLLAILFGVWLWRRNRLNALKEKQQDKPNQASTQAQGGGQAHANEALQQPSAMHPCDHCGVHLPETDMVKGSTGRYCSDSHRLASGDKPN